MEKKLCKVFRLRDELGCGYLLEEGIPGREFLFPYFTVRGYKGETASELGLQKGDLVWGVFDDKGNVKEVFPVYFRA